MTEHEDFTPEQELRIAYYVGKIREAKTAGKRMTSLKEIPLAAPGEEKYLTAAYVRMVNGLA